MEVKLFPMSIKTISGHHFDSLKRKNTKGNNEGALPVSIK